MQYSHSRVELSKNCPYKYKLRYLDKVKTIPYYEPNNALICGNTIHTGAEKNLKEALEFYKSHYPVISDLNIDEIIKFEHLIPKLKELLEGINIYKQEYLISTKRFKGIVDLITKNEDGTIDVFDFKYSNNISHYMESPQLHIYKHFLEEKGFKVNRLGFIFVPKISIRQKKDESLYQFRKRLMTELENSEIKLLEVKYDPNKVIEFMNDIISITEIKDYSKNVTRLCDWCEYKEHCLKGEDYMLLPKNERREVEKVTKKVIWIYGAPFSGKTTFANDFPDPLMLNTDGNIKFVDAPYIAIKDEVKVEGRITHKTLAWQVFKDVIGELEKKQNDFKTIIVDLLEDTYEYCRLFKYDEMNITHESDDSFRAWDKVRTEFLSTLKRLLNLDYENIILISHVDMSKDITKKGGDKVTKIAPNLNEKCANKVAGMVDIVARVIAEDDKHTLNFKTSEVIFGGGRLHVKTEKIPLELEELMRVYDEVNTGKKDTPKSENKEEVKPSRRARKSEAAEETNSQEDSLPETNTTESEVKSDETIEPGSVADETQKEEINESNEDKPKRKRRTKKVEGDINE